MRQATTRPPQPAARVAAPPARLRRAAEDDGQPYRRGPAAPRPRRRALLLGAATLFVFGLFGTVAWYAYLEGLAGLGGEPPLIRAEAGPYKHVPDDRGGLAVSNQSAAVIDVFKPAPEVPEPESLPPPAEAPPPPDPTAATARIEAPPDAPDPASLPPIVAEEPAPAPPPPAEVAAVPLPPPELPEALDASEPAPPPGQDLAALPPDEPPPDDVAAAAGAGVWVPVPKPVAAGPTPPPPARAERQPPRAAAAPNRPAPPPARAEPPPRATTAALEPALAARPAVGNSYRLQLLALRSEGAMNQAWAQLRQRYPAVLDGLAPSVERIATVSGTMYRLQAGPFSSRDAATDACAAIQAQGGQCFVVSLAQ